MNSISISTTFTPDNTPVREALNVCLENGIHSVEIGSNHCYESDYSYVKDYSFEYLVHNYFPVPKESFVVNIASLDENIHQRSIKHIKDSIEFCSKINARLYTFHPGFLTDPKGSNPSNQNYDFQWESVRLKTTSYEAAWERMTDAISEIAPYACNRKVPKKNHLMMQQPKEYERFLNFFPSDAIGINLNIGHLILAANAFEFSYQTFVDIVADYVVAMELSHNNGVEDQHLPLQSDGWYWPLILDNRFENTYKILEFRNSKIENIQDVISIFIEELNAA